MKLLSLLQLCFLFYSFIGLSATVSLTHPTNSASLSGRVTLSADVSSTVGMTSFVFTVDGVRITSPVLTGPFQSVFDTRSILNGTHAISAVASYASGEVKPSSSNSVTVSNPPGYFYTSNSFVINNLGPLISTSTMEKQYMFHHPITLDTHLLLYYRTVADDDPLQILDVNLTLVTNRLVDGPVGRPGPNATIMVTNTGKVYFGTHFFAEYDPQTGLVDVITNFQQNVTGSYSTAQIMEMGDDGYIYTGKCCLGGVERYNPSTDDYENLGSMDTNYVAGIQYAYTVGADLSHLYVGLGQLDWYLVALNLSDQSRTNYWKGAGDLSGYVLKSKSGGWYYQRRTSTNTTLWYSLSGGNPTEVAAGSVPPLFGIWEDRGNVIAEPTMFEDEFGVAVNLSEADPYTGHETVTISWLSTGETNSISSDATGFYIQPTTIKRLKKTSEGALLGAADFYGPVFEFNPNTISVSVFGRPQINVYDMQLENNWYYISGYPSYTMVYQPSYPWTLNASTFTESPQTFNPIPSSLRLGKYHYYSAIGSDGYVYLASQHIRDSVGGELGWFNPRGVQSGNLRDPFAIDDPTDLISVLSGKKIVYASETNGLFVFDVATKAVDRTIPLSAVSGLLSFDKVVEVSQGVVFGASGTKIFAINLQDGDSVVMNQSISGEAFGGSSVPREDRRLILGPDRMVWMFIGGTLCRVNPMSGSVENVVSTTARSIVFVGRDLYFYGSSDLGVIRNCLNEVSNATADSATVGRIVVR